MCSLALVAATAHLSSTVHRSGLWFRHIISWIIYSASFLLLVGNQFTPTPPFGLCMVQAALIYAAPTLPTLSGVCFVVDLSISLSSAIYGKTKMRPALSKFLLVSPQIVYVLVFFEVLLVVQEPGIVVRDVDHLYCHITSPIPTLVSASIVICTGIVIVPLEIWIAVLVCRNWDTFRRSNLRMGDPHTSLTMLIRVALYTVMSLTGVGLGSISLASTSVPYWQLVLPIVPFLAAITFGTQTDLMRCYAFWRKSEAETSDPKESTVYVPVV
ncbi:hypothetical protein K438DRAFT_238677 [Mycena galopus ATCC 62051]|nr:hypothetical protein K438DRAFT_238677 [Mycena galopus ATCC 62051]